MNLVIDECGIQTLDGKFLSADWSVTPERVRDLEEHARDVLTIENMTAEIFAAARVLAVRLAMEARGDLDGAQVENAVAVEQRLVAIVLDGIAEGRTYA